MHYCTVKQPDTKTKLCTSGMYRVGVGGGVGQVAGTVFYTVCKWYAECVCVGGGGENTMFYTTEKCRKQGQVQVGDGGDCTDD